MIAMFLRVVLKIFSGNSFMLDEVTTTPTRNKLLMKRLIKLTSQVNFYFFHDSPVEQTSPVEHSKRGQATAVVGKL